MREAIASFLSEHLGKGLSILICSLIPIIECRGAVPLGCFLLEMPWWQTAIFAFIGNILPVPFILLFMRKILEWMTHCRIKFLNKFGNWLYNKVEKHKGRIVKEDAGEGVSTETDDAKARRFEAFTFWGIVLFVGIPLPGTGAWTGSLICAVLHLDFKKSLLASAIGVLLAITIMTVLSYGLKLAF